MRVRSLSLALLAAALASPAFATDNPARLTFTKVFKGRVPEYVRVVVAEDGQTSYHGGTEMDPGEEDSFRLSPPLVERLFSLAASLNYFRGVELEASQPVADLGRKTFIYERGGQRAEVTYNYTQNKTAEDLQGLCEAIARGRFWIRELESRLVYDRLGVLETLRGFERDFNTGQLVDLEQFAPLLARMAADRRLMRLAQIKAQALLDRIHGAPAHLQIEYGDQRADWYLRLLVPREGPATWERRRFAQPPQEESLSLPAGLAARLFELARAANYLRGGVTSSDPTAPLSGYRLTYESGPEHNEAAFAAPPDAVLAEIVNLFQRVIRQEDFRSRLRTAVEENAVDLQVVLQELEAAVQTDAVADPKEFVPLLEQIAGGTQAHPRVREQAARLLAEIRSRAPA